MRQEKSQRVNTMKQVKRQTKYMKTKANLHSHQVKVILVKKNLLFGVISLLLKGGGGEPQAACNYYGTTYAYDTKCNDTTNMRTHIQSQFWNIIIGKTKKNQSTLALKPKEEGESSGKLMPWVFNFKECKKTLAEMIILDELSFKFVEDFGFRKFMFVT